MGESIGKLGIVGNEIIAVTFHVLLGWADQSCRREKFDATAEFTFLVAQTPLHEEKTPAIGTVPREMRRIGTAVVRRKGTIVHSVILALHVTIAIAISIARMAV